MKRYLVFVLLLVVISLKSYGENYSTVYRFYDKSGQTIDNVVYEVAFNIDIVINYDGTVPADKLLLNLKLPIDNYQYINYITPNVTSPVIAGQHTYNGNILTIPLTGFATNQGFTIHLLNVYLRRNQICENRVFSFTSTMNASLGGVVNPSFETTPTSLSITAKHRLGQVYSSFPPSQYDNTRNNNQPFYVDLYYEISQGTYPSNQMLFSITALQPIKKVVLLSTTNSVELTKDANQQYYFPLSAFPGPGLYGQIQQYYNVRVYFDVTSSNFSLNLNVVSKFDISCGTVPGNNFPISFTTPSNIANKNDDLLLQYPSIFGSNYAYMFDLNYDSRTIAVVPCNKSIASFYLDNIYNQPIGTPVTTTFTNLQSLLIENITFDTEMLPTVSVKYINSGTFQTLNYDPANPGVIIFSNSANIETIKMTYSSIQSKISRIEMLFTTSSANAAITYNLLKTDLVYSSFTKNFNSAEALNFVTFDFVTSTVNKAVVGIGESVTNIFYLQKQKSLKVGDYIEYKLNHAMKFPANIETQIEISTDKSLWQWIGDFNTANIPSGSPQIQCQRIDDYTIRIINIPIVGYYSSCLLSDQKLYFRFKTLVVDRPLTTVNNANTVNIMPFDLTNPYNNQKYIWSIDVTENILPIINFSCDQTTFSESLTIKSGDDFLVQYTLQNIVPIKFDDSTPVLYINLLQPGVVPALSLSQINGLDLTTKTLTTADYNLSYTTINLNDGNTMQVNYLNTYTYSPEKTATSNVLKVTFNSVIVDYYDKIVMTAAYPSGLILPNGTFVNLSLSLGSVKPTSFHKSTLKIGPKSDCDLFNCVECITSFSPTAGEEYILSAWVKESFTDNPPTTYQNAGIRVTFNDGAIDIFPLFKATGPIVDGWQRIEASFRVPTGAKNIHITLVNQSPNTDVFFDDIRVHPYNSNMKSFVYDPSTQKLVAELDENNFATIYEYDDEGILIRVKKETERGVMTIKETRSNQSKIK